MTNIVRDATGRKLMDDHHDYDHHDDHRDYDHHDDHHNDYHHDDHHDDHRDDHHDWGRKLMDDNDHRDYNNNNDHRDYNNNDHRDDNRCVKYASSLPLPCMLVDNACMRSTRELASAPAMTRTTMIGVFLAVSWQQHAQQWQAPLCIVSSVQAVLCLP